MREILTALRVVVLSMLGCCVLYPAVLLSFGQILMPWKANGSLLCNKEGQVIGSAPIAQAFTRPQYFWPRPSAVNYDAGGAGGSNLSPTDPKLAKRAADIRMRYGLTDSRSIPADLVTTSGSGLDPHITLAAARFQLPRVAVARALPQEKLEALIHQHTETPMLRVFGGELLVNVLRLNVALDGLTEGEATPP